MGTYKVIQDIEAEDKLLGPLTLRQFIYALVAAFFFYLSFLVATKGASFLLVLFLPPALLCAFFAFPFSKDQPTEVWALAKIRFFLKPRRRIWDQSGLKQLVTITVPKKVERVLSNGLSQTEVTSRLKALAQTIDSRGWAIKNVNVNLYSQPSPLTHPSSDRLIDINSMPKEVPSYDVQAADDIMDSANNPIAQHFDQMIQTSEKNHRQQLMQELNGVHAATAQQTPSQSTPADYWFLNQAGAAPSSNAANAAFGLTPIIQPGTQNNTPQTTITQAANPTPTEEALVKKLAAQSQQAQAVSYGHMRTVQPLNNAQQAAATTQPLTATNNPTTVARSNPPDPAILNLANNNDLNIATIAREAHKAKGIDDPHDEVVIPLR